ncbi:ribonuclease H-like domain-containing protein [Tanacetum coccineum]
MFGLHHQINTLMQNGSFIDDYYHKLNALWKQFDAMIELPKCVCNASKVLRNNQLMKLMQFLMGLDDSYMQIRSTILFREVLPDVRSAYATISSEESHRVDACSIVGPSQRNQAFAFVSNVPNRVNFQRNVHNLNNGPRPNNLNNNRQGGVLGKNASNNNFVRSSSSSGFTDEQMETLISFIKDNKNEKNVQELVCNGKIIDSGANQHMTYTDKELDNILDISHLKIKVGHPNETKAFISKIENLELSNGLILYDVLVIPKYCDLSLRSVLGTGSQCEGLYYYNDQVCQRAKQTREPFPLSAHVSSSLGDLVHLDLWGPYKIPNDDERVDPKLNSDNKSHSDSSSSFESGRNSFTADLSVNSENDADSIDNIFSTQDEGVTTLEENIVSGGNLGQNPSSSSQDAQNLRRSSRQSVFPRNYNDFGGFQSNKVCRIKKYLYGLKQAPRQWNAKLTSTLIENGFIQSKSDYYLYTKSDKGVFLALLVYVDDIIITGNNVSEIEKFKVFLKSKFMIKDSGKLKYFLGIEVIDTDNGICINQRKHVLDLLSEYGMLACKPINTSLISKLVISNEATKKDLVLDNITDYQS